MGTSGLRGLAGCLLVAALAAGCGEDEFANDPRPPVPLELTAVINDDEVRLSPTKVGAGPVLITVANQTTRDHTVILEGETLVRRQGPVAPGDTTVIRRTLSPGSYEVRAGTEMALPKEIAPAMLEIGAERRNSNEDLLLP